MTTRIGPTLRTLFAPTALNAAVVDGYVRRQEHPEYPLAILNYTEKAAYEGVWDTVTLTCRGLIYNTDTLEIAARPFARHLPLRDHLPDEPDRAGLRRPRRPGPARRR